MSTHVGTTELSDREFARREVHALPTTSGISIRFAMISSREAGLQNDGNFFA